MKITHKQFDEAVVEYYKNYECYKSLRFGQFLMNVLVPKEINPEIFYEENDEIARNKFIMEFVI